MLLYGLYIKNTYIFIDIGLSKSKNPYLTVLLNACMTSAIIFLAPFIHHLGVKFVCNYSDRYLHCSLRA